MLLGIFVCFVGFFFFTLFLFCFLFASFCSIYEMIKCFTGYASLVHKTGQQVLSDVGRRKFISPKS